MSTEQTSLINVESSDEDRALIAATASSSSFLPYLQLFTTKSTAVTEDKIQGGHYGLVVDQAITDLGKEINIVFLAVRARAFEKTQDGVNVVFNKDDPEYKRIAATAAADKNAGCMAGPEFLIWLPAEKTFATLFCGSTTLQREAKKWGTFLGGKAATLKVRLCVSTDQKYKWHGPVTSSCSTPLSPLPELEKANEQIVKFKNPPKSTKVKAEADAQDEVER